jgi:hypothetical protein
MKDPRAIDLTRDEFIYAIELLGFVDGQDSGLFSRPSGWPRFYVNVEDTEAYASYDYGGDTGPIEITDPVLMPFGEALVELVDSLEEHR